MKPIPDEDMTEATRLTRRGRLAEATALIQRLLSGVKPARTAAKAPPHSLAGNAHVHAPVETPAHEQITTAAMLQPVVDATQHNRVDAQRGTVEAPLQPWLHGTQIPVVDARGRTGEADTFAAHRYSGAAGRRDYKLYVPAGYCGEPCPLVVMLHGCTQSADDFAGGTNMNAVAGEHGCLVAYPIQSKAANQAKCWNWFNPRDQQRGAGEPAIVVGIVRQIMHGYAVDPNRIYVAGLSAGGAAAAVLGAQYPDVFAAIGVHSGIACGLAHDVASAFAVMHGRVPDRASGSAAAVQNGHGRQPPTIVFHGDCDRTVHPSNGDRIVAWSQVSSADATVETGRVPGGHSYTRERFHDDRSQVVVERWTVHGAGHAWSGGSAAHSYTDPAGPNASEAMMRFFLAHPAEHPRIGR